MTWEDDQADAEKREQDSADGFLMCLGGIAVIIVLGILLWLASALTKLLWF